MLDRDELLEHVEWLLNEGESERAWKLCKRGLRQFPKDAELWLFLGDSYFEADRYPEAEKAFKRAAEIDPEWADPQARRAELELSRGDFVTARCLAEQAHERDRDSAHASFVLGICSELEESHELARFWYHRARRLQPDGYFVPLAAAQATFDEALTQAMEQLSSSSDGERLPGSEWTVLSQVDANRTDLANLSPLTRCHIVSGQTGGEKSAVLRGYLCTGNILRDCRSQSDVCTQTYFAILDQLEVLFGDESEEA